MCVFFLFICDLAVSLSPFTSFSTDFGEAKDSVLKPRSTALMAADALITAAGV
jgi:hypothetical protein